MAKKAKLPADLNKRAKSIVDIATGGDQETTPKDEVKAAAAKEQTPMKRNIVLLNVLVLKSIGYRVNQTN